MTVHQYVSDHFVMVSPCPTHRVGATFTAVCLPSLALMGTGKLDGVL